MHNALVPATAPQPAWFGRRLLLPALAALLGLLSPASATAASFRGMGYGDTDTHMVLVVNADGSCILTNEAVEPRKALERQVVSWERYAKMQDSGPDDEDAAGTPTPAPKPPEAKALTNEELATKLHDLYQQNPEMGENTTLKVENAEGATNSVRVVSTRTFGSLKDLLSQSSYSWGPSLLMPADARLEIDTNRNLRLTFTADPGFTANSAYSRYVQNLGKAWKASKLRFEWKLVLPGKILSSGLPHTEDHATWISLNGEQADSVEAALKLVGQPLVITAEAAGLKLEEPLESKKLESNPWRRRAAEPEVPITEASPGYQAEPASVELATVHYFPEGEKYVKDHPEAFNYGMGTTGTVISAKFFAPKGRILRSVSEVRVKSAKDDQGRAIAGGAGATENADDFESFTSFTSGNSDKEGSATTIQLRLGLPAPDAKTIDEVQAEAVALTIGGWKELVLTNVQADAKKEIDLSEVLPGAKLIIKKVSAKSPQKRVEATLEGPAAVGQLDVGIKLNGRQGGNSNMSEQQSKTTAGKTTRSITVQGYEFEMGEGPQKEARPVTLVVRFPQDVKRERVQFKLTALDLL